MHSRDYWLREEKRLGHRPTDRDDGELIPFHPDVRVKELVEV